MAGVDNNRRIQKLQNQYSNKEIKIGSDKNAPKVKMSVFSEGMTVTSDVKAFLDRFDFDKDGKISKEEAVVIQKVLVDYAGGDKKLTKEEFAQAVGLDVNTPEFERMYKSFEILLTRQTSGTSQSVITNKDGMKITSNFNADGSGTEVIEGKYNGAQVKTTVTYGKGHVKEKSVNENLTNGDVTTSEYINNEKGKPTRLNTIVVDKSGNIKASEEIQYEYNDAGNVVSKKTAKAGPDGQVYYTSEATSAYNEDGKKVSQHNVITDTKKGAKETTDSTFDPETGKVLTAHKVTQKTVGEEVITITTDDNFVYENGKLVRRETTGVDEKGRPTSTIDTVGEDGKTIIARERTYYKGDALYKDSFNGQNIENRMKGGIPTERIIYEEDGVTVKEKIVNKFDEKGIIIGQEKYDKDGNLIYSKDFSQFDGHFDVAHQVARGDCYLLATINAFSQTADGAKILEQNVKQNADGSFEITLPGADAIRSDILAGKLGKEFSEDSVPISGKITITKEELDDAMLRSGKDYSYGDKDVLVLEIAYEKYRKSVADFMANNNLKPEDCSSIPALRSAAGAIKRNQTDGKHDPNDVLSGGQGFEVAYLFTGNYGSSISRNTKQLGDAPVCYISQPDLQMSIPSASKDAKPINDPKFDAMMANIIKDSADGKIDDFAVMVGFNVSQQEVNGEIIKDGGHEFTIKRATENEVVLSNPWDPEKDIVMSMDDFKKAVTTITTVPLNDKAKTEYPQTPEGETVVDDSSNSGSSGTAQTGTTYTVKRGDNLWKIAKRQLGSKAKNSQIADYVQKLIAANPQIKNPNLIHVGDKINIPV